MKAVACAANSLNVLAGCPEGSVHSVFANSLNLQFGQRLIHLSAGNYGRLPFGLIMENAGIGALLARAEQGNQVLWDEKRNLLRFEREKIHLSLAETSIYESHRTCIGDKLSSANYDALLYTLAGQDRACGLGLTISQALVEAGVAVGNRDDTSVLNRLQQASVSEDTALIEAVLRYLIGRGAGLTPSGDDILTGFLLGVWTCGHSHTTFRETFNRLIAEEGSMLTTQISLEYLYYAGQGQFGSHLHDLAQALFTGTAVQVRAATKKVLDVGSTSGLDTLIGLITYLTILGGANSLGEDHTSRLRR